MTRGYVTFTPVRAAYTLLLNPPQRKFPRRLPDRAPIFRPQSRPPHDAIAKAARKQYNRNLMTILI